MIFRHMTYSSGSLFFFAPAADSVKFLLCPPPPPLEKKKEISLCFCVSLPHLSVALFLECTLILSFPLLPSLRCSPTDLFYGAPSKTGGVFTAQRRFQVTGTTQTYVSFLPTLLCLAPPSHHHLTHTHTLPACLYKDFSGLERGGWGGVILRVSTSVAIRIQSAYGPVGLYTSFLRRSSQQDKANSIIRPACSISTIDLAPELQHNT